MHSPLCDVSIVLRSFDSSIASFVIIALKGGTRSALSFDNQRIPLATSELDLIVAIHFCCMC